MHVPPTKRAEIANMRVRIKVGCILTVEGGEDLSKLAKAFGRREQVSGVTGTDKRGRGDAEYLRFWTR